MNIKDLLSLGAPGLLAIIAGLLWDRFRILTELKEERGRSEEIVDAMVALNEKLIDRLPGKN